MQILVGTNKVLVVLRVRTIGKW